MSREGYFRQVLAGNRRDLPARLLGAVLSPLALPYALVMRLRALAYAWGVLRTHRLGRPVISVGNLTAGGTGKTPTAALLARMLLARGMRVALLSRGYGGSLEGETRIVSDGCTVFLSAVEAGDEPVLLARTVQGLMVVIGADRYQAGLLAERELAPDIFLLDDGFQHIRLYRDLNILLLDCRNPFGNGRTLPAGLLREPRSAAARADLVIFTRCAENDAPTASAGLPSCRAGHRLTALEPLPEGETIPFAALTGERVFVFAGIAEPEHFFAGLRAAGLAVVGSLPLSDHCRYGEAEIAALRRQAAESGASVFVTTGKDAVKLTPFLSRLGRTYAATLELDIFDPAPLEAALDKVLSRER